MPFRNSTGYGSASALRSTSDRRQVPSAVRAMSVMSTAGSDPGFLLRIRHSGSRLSVARRSTEGE